MKLYTAVFLVLRLLPLSFLPICPATYVSFPLTHRDARASVIRVPEADLSGMAAEEMPMQDFVAAGHAMRARQRRRMGKAGGVVGRFSYFENVGEFYLTASVGNPPQHLIFILDTGSELTWTQCTPCNVCGKGSGPTFAFKKSSSYKVVPHTSPLCVQSLGFSGGCINSTELCIFQLQYGDGSAEAGFISLDSFHLTGRTSRSILFGCTVVDLEKFPGPRSGIMGLNAGPFSFTSQLLGENAGLPKRFAYCLPDRFKNLNSQGTILFGGYRLPSPLKYTPLTPPFGPLGQLYYFVKLEGISVGNKLFGFTMPQEGLHVTGTIFDSGTALTHLLSPWYENVVAEMRRQTQSLHPFSMKGTASDVCYRVPLKAKELPTVPTITMHFAGMVELELGLESVLYPAENDDEAIVFCLAFASYSTEANESFNIIGNYQQQNYWVEHNLQTSMLGLAKANCARP